MFDMPRYPSREILRPATGTGRRRKRHARYGVWAHGYESFGVSGEDDEGVGWYNMYSAFGDEEYVCGWYVFLLSFFVRVIFVERSTMRHLLRRRGRFRLVFSFYLFLRALLSDFFTRIKF